MAMEHYRPNGNLAQGYYCSRCGASGMSMYGHHFLNPPCEANPTLTKALERANPPKGIKPRFTITADIT